MFRQFFAFCLILALVGSSMAYQSDENGDDSRDGLFSSNENIVVKAEPRMALRTRRPIRFKPSGNGQSKDRFFSSDENIVVKAEPSMALRTRRPIRFVPSVKANFYE
ncbi:unnamed protein product [Caenorhabditis brenneri]